MPLISAEDAAGLSNVSLSYVRNQIKLSQIKQASIQITTHKTNFGNAQHTKKQTVWLYDYDTLINALNRAIKANRRLSDGKISIAARA